MPYQSVASQTLAAGQDLGRLPVHFSGDCPPAAALSVGLRHMSQTQQQ